MIGKLKGKVDYIRNSFAVVDVQGLGYKVQLSEVSAGKIAKENKVELFIHTYVREDQLTLYGFIGADELEIFELLISVSGIGPKAALSILNIASPDSIKTAILNQNVSILTRVSGVGKRTAERVVMELQNKIEDLPEAAMQEARGDQEVMEALMAMGYSASEAREAAKAVEDKSADVSEKIKLALKSIKR
ncbi:MAG: Holliday junction branch migration protein RuvA [Candidatus Moranbacteria bacterium]|nr:Holliday junction branch migration protein RuvA [Candidatus Moranbacteria bacterium]